MMCHGAQMCLGAHRRAATGQGVEEGCLAAAQQLAGPWNEPRGGNSAGNAPADAPAPAADVDALARVALAWRPGPGRSANTSLHWDAARATAELLG